jgi:hypothetical protein
MTVGGGGREEIVSVSESGRSSHWPGPPAFWPPFSFGLFFSSSLEWPSPPHPAILQLLSEPKCPKVECPELKMQEPVRTDVDGFLRLELVLFRLMSQTKCHAAPYAAVLCPLLGRVSILLLQSWSRGYNLQISNSPVCVLLGHVLRQQHLPHSSISALSFWTL